MGRPRDEFSWKQVEVSNDGWKCKFCREDFKGSASRIRNHLSGEGNDISACAAVPEQIRNEALKKVTRKRGRSLQISSSSSTTSLCQGPSPSSINDDPIAFTKMASEEYVTDAFIKFLMCGKFSSVGSQVLKDPFFREYLERTNRHGVPLSLLQDNSFVIEKSVFKIKHELNQYMLRVAESWKKTGCTLMKFNLNQEKKGKFSSNLEKDMYAIAIYCPKGIIFMETPHLMGNYQDYYDALEKHSPSLRIDGAPYHRWMFHGPKYNGLGEDHLCDLKDEMTIGWTYNGLTDCEPGGDRCRCLQHEIKGFCIDICSRSEWAQSLITEAVWIHENLCHDRFESWYHEILKKKGLRFNLFVDTHASRLSIFLSIMMLEDEVKEKVLYQLRSQYRYCFHPQAAHLEGILNDSRFWRSGSILKEVITMTWKTPDVMDTLVPTTGYLAMAIDMLKDEIVRKYVPKMALEEFTFWQEIESKLSGITRGIDSATAASYLNPVYFLQQDVQKHSELLEHVKVSVYDCEGYKMEEEEWEKLEGEVGRYGDVFSSLESAGIRLADYHPVMLWEKYGHELPLLRKWAIMLLSQPVSCMRNQVKKHVYQLQGADDFILRLNVRMMEEFKLLGDNIYNPIECHLRRLSGNIYEHTQPK